MTDDKPKVMDQIRSLATAAVEIAKARSTTVDPAELQHRRRICLGTPTTSPCERLVNNWKDPIGGIGTDNGIDWANVATDNFETAVRAAYEDGTCLPRCRECGCPIVKKTATPGVCPLGKW